MEVSHAIPRYMTVFDITVNVCLLIGPVLLSTMIQTKAFLFFMKERLVVLTDERIIVANAKSKQPRFVNRYSDL